MSNNGSTPPPSAERPLRIAVVGAVPEDSVLTGLDSWLAGSVTLDQAEDACGDDPLLPEGDVVLSQYVRDELDRNTSCD